MKPTRARSGLLKLCGVVVSLSVCAGSLASAMNLMLDFGATPVGTDYTTLSPAHSTGSLTSSDTAWNTISSSAPNSSLSWSDGTAATGVVLTMGQEAAAGSNQISFSTPITSTALAGTGGGATNPIVMTNLNHSNASGFTGSIYGEGTASTPARDGFFGSANSAIGLRLDGLTAGQYMVYVMARNTNTNTATVPMTVHATAAASSPSFNFSSVASQTQYNVSFPLSSYAGEYTYFYEEDNYVSMQVTVLEGQSLFLAVDGTGAEARGFLNAVQLVLIPEPSVSLLGAVGALALLRRRRN